MKNERYKVIDDGELYATYSEWFDENEVDPLDWESGYFNGLEKGDVVEIIAKHKHDFCDDIVCFVNRVRDDVKFLIGESGLKEMPDDIIELGSKGEKIMYVHIYLDENGVEVCEEEQKDRKCIAYYKRHINNFYFRDTGLSDAVLATIKLATFDLIADEEASCVSHSYIRRLDY